MPITKTVQLPVDPDEAFALITQPERLRRWQAVSATVDLRVGGSYRWTVTPGHLAQGTFQEIVPGKQIVFGWGWPEDADLGPDASTVTITLEPNEAGTILTLTHEGLTAEQAVGHEEGWTHFLERLAKLATTGDAGQDEWAWAPETLDQFTAAEAALAAFQPVLRNLTAEDQPKQTPCAEFTCHSLAVHLFTSFLQLAGLAGGTATNPEEGRLENKISVMAGQAIDAWRARGLEGTVMAGDRELPASFAAGILPVEILLHAWDMAQGSGQELKVSDEVVSYIATLAETIVPGGRGTSFGDEQPAPEGASALDRLAAFAGRTPIAAGVTA
jgi:uncharacterized protein (TIGR03086 family)